MMPFFRIFPADRPASPSGSANDGTGLLLAAASVVVLAVAALAGIVPLTEQPGQVTVLNPESYLLVGGTWAVDLEVLEGGDLSVAADGAGL